MGREEVGVALKRMMGEATLALAEGGGRGGREGLRDGPPLDGGGAVLVGGAFSTELEGGGCKGWRREEGGSALKRVVEGVALAASEEGGRGVMDGLRDVAPLDGRVAEGGLFPSARYDGCAD